MSLLECHQHTNFEKETATFSRRFRTFPKDLEAFKKIANVHFSPTSPKAVIGPAKLNRVFETPTYVIWKVEMSVQGLRANQSPRVWFAIYGAKLVFLCLGTHIDNYDNSEREAVAKELVTDYF